ncbi:MAG: pyruvate kinase [Bacillota bacterium]|nr:pyruvate kinase [Bacillota bacterium]
MLRKTKIVCTIGPACESYEMFTALVKAGLNVARLNFSHGSHAEHLVRVNTIKKVREELDAPVAILLDTKGPEIRTGTFDAPSYMLERGQKFTLTSEEVVGNAHISKVSYAGLPKDVKSGDRILIDDGLIELVVDSVEGNHIHTTVQNGGEIKNNKGINVPGVKINLPAITERDESDLLFAVEHELDFIAASFIRKAEDVLEIRKILEKHGGGNIKIISKIENQEGVDNLEEILRVSDGLMVARGDLGVEISTEIMPIVQKQIIEKCNMEGKPVITATQMLDSMMRNPRPTRAETTDVANAIFDGTDAVMLSGETAVGHYPVEAVTFMSKIAMATEEVLKYDDILDSRIKSVVEQGVTEAVSHATARAALDLNAGAILTATSSGFTARKVSKLRPKSAIIACTTTESVRRWINLLWGVYPMVIEDADSTDKIFDIAVESSKEKGLIADGDIVVISAGVPVGISGATNLMKVQLVGEVLIKGLGVVPGKVSGRSIVGSCSEELKQNGFAEGDIIIAKSVDSDMIPYIKQASAIVVEEGGYNSTGAVIALSISKPCIVGVYRATELIKTGVEITVNSSKNIVFASNSRKMQ